MKKIVAGLLMLSVFGFAKSGEDVYKQKCMACHTIDKKTKTMKAPPLAMVSARVKMVKRDKANFIEFVKDYITNPDKNKGVCFPRAYKKFGVMPPIGKSMSDAEKTAVAKWMYSLNTAKFEKMFKGGMKCGGGSCDNKKPKMKCGPGKCGM